MRDAVHIRTGLYHVVLCVLTLSAATLAGAQKVHPAPTRPIGSVGTTGTSTNNNPPGAYSPYGTDIPEADQRGEILREHARAEERQRRMVEDANRLVVLTERYRASISEQRGSNAEDAKLLLDIQKLARSVKDRMRGQ
jgi:hypothetical protein